MRAEEDLRLLNVFASSQSSEAIKKLVETLVAEQESPIIIEKGMDKDAIERLRALSEKMNG